MSQSRQLGAATAYIDGLLRVGRVGFSLEHLLAKTGLGEPAARSQLHRLGPRVVRVPSAHSFYLIVTPEHLAQGAPPVEWWLDDYFQWLKRPYYLALQSAAGVHGSSPQAIQVTQVMTDRPMRPVAIGRLKIQFFMKRRAARTLTQEVANTYAPVRVSTPAATMFDLVRYAPRLGGIGRAVETLRPLLPLVRGADLGAVLASEDETATAQRLGYVLDQLGQPRLAAAVDRWLPGKRPITMLAPGRPDGSKPANRWRVVDHTGEFVP